jgi:hypothetical protein
MPAISKTAQIRIPLSFDFSVIGFEAPEVDAVHAPLFHTS